MALSSIIQLPLCTVGHTSLSANGLLMGWEFGHCGHPTHKPPCWGSFTCVLHVHVVVLICMVPTGACTIHVHVSYSGKFGRSVVVFHIGGFKFGVLAIAHWQVIHVQIELTNTGFTDIHVLVYLAHYAIVSLCQLCNYTVYKNFTTSNLSSILYMCTVNVYSACKIYCTCNYYCCCFSWNIYMYMCVHVYECMAWSVVCLHVCTCEFTCLFCTWMWTFLLIYSWLVRV